MKEGLSSTVSIFFRSTVPAEKSLMTLPFRRSTRAMWLFSCNVTTATFSSLMSTYSGSGSSGKRSDTPVRLTARVLQVLGAPTKSTMARKPPGNWGRAPSLTSSSRWFSMAMAP